MGEINVNFSEVQSRSVVPAGEYPAVIADCLLKQKAGSDHPYLNWDVIISEGEHEGRHVFGTTTFKPEGLFNMMNYFRNLGFQDEEFNIKFDDETGQVIEPEVVGMACVARVFNEPYQNRQTSKIDVLLGPNGEEADAPIEEAAAASPAARPATRAAAKPAAKSNGPAPAAAAAAKRSPFPAAGGAKRSFK